MKKFVYAGVDITIDQYGRFCWTDPDGEEEASWTPRSRSARRPSRRPRSPSPEEQV